MLHKRRISGIHSILMSMCESEGSTRADITEVHWYQSPSKRTRRVSEMSILYIKLFEIIKILLINISLSKHK